MATIALSGTGTDKKVVLKTVDGVQKVSCSCCETCATLPQTLTIVFSGIQKCANPGGDPPPGWYADSSITVINGLYEVTRNSSIFDTWIYSDATYQIRVKCSNAASIMSGSGGSYADRIPSGIALDDGTTPLFEILYYTLDPEEPALYWGFFGRTDSIAWQYASKSSPGTSGMQCNYTLGGYFDRNLASGGIATISWE